MIPNGYVVVHWYAMKVVEMCRKKLAGWDSNQAGSTQVDWVLTVLAPHGWIGPQPHGQYGGIGPMNQIWPADQCVKYSVNFNAEEEKHAQGSKSLGTT